MGETTNEPDFVGGFTAAAASYAELDEAVWNPISTATVARSRPMFDELVLDACSGDGASALPTAELVGPGGVVDAVDLTAGLVDIARERAGDRLPQLRLHVADVTTWEPTGYDLVQCVLGVLFFDDLDAGTRHLVERAKPGGRMAVTVWARGALEPVPEVLATALPADLALRLQGGSASPSISDVDTPGTLAQWLTGLGLVRVRAEIVRRHLDLDEGLAWSLVTGTGLRAFLVGLDDDELKAVRGRYLAGLAEREVTSIDLTTLVAVGFRAD
ncbi:class I SAM-dependent methyltransferase [Agromyces sp. NPDC058064]|uniref:class I SAM-dependent methyltransferase n=1 Tax=Agromyces sp. NPDC058064 TaxID=3346322 RepID=UPI0036DEC574